MTTAERKQVCIIHGGVAFDSDEQYQQSLKDLTLNYERLLYAPGWKTWLAEQLTDHDVLLPSMPNKINAKYADWSVYFSKVLPFLSPSAVIVGHSLGGIFLAKYFSEHTPEVPFQKIILIAAPYDDASDESLGDFAFQDATSLAAAAKEIHLFYSTDDPLVPFAEANKYLKDLPTATLHKFTNRQHFNTPTFLELKNLINN